MGSSGAGAVRGTDGRMARMPRRLGAGGAAGVRTTGAGEARPGRPFRYPAGVYQESRPF